MIINSGGDKVIYKSLSYQIVGILYEVYNELGYGYQEKTYKKAIARNFIDFVVDEKIVLEIKQGNYFSKRNIEQIKKYLAVTGLKLALLAHFTSREVKIFRALNPNNKNKKYS